MRGRLQSPFQIVALGLWTFETDVHVAVVDPAQIDHLPAGPGALQHGSFRCRCGFHLKRQMPASVDHRIRHRGTKVELVLLNALRALAVICVDVERAYTHTGKCALQPFHLGEVPVGDRAVRADEEEQKKAGLRCGESSEGIRGACEHGLKHEPGEQQEKSAS